jgi:parallel beta-helix repeat protein
VILDGSALDSVPVLAVDGAAAVLRGLSVVRGPRDGVRFDNAPGSVVEGCLFGVDDTYADGNGNGWFGLSSFAATGMVIGGPNVGQRNVMAGNELGGFQNWSNGIGLFNNTIGLEDAPNLGTGVVLAMDDAVIGGDSDGWGNVIAHTLGNGIGVGGQATGNDIRGNRIFGNGALGIDLLGEQYGDVTENDVDDVDTGANDRQNFPVLDTVTTADGTLTIAGTLDVPADRLNTAYKLRLYASAECDESGHGEGEEFLGAIDILVGSDEGFGAIVPAIVAPFRQVTATVTDPATSNTSEFSACVTALPDVIVCGDATSDGKVLASDALAVLKAAVGSFSCATCVCDANGSGSVLAGDAQLVLRKAVGQAVTLTCPPCN